MMVLSWQSIFLHVLACDICYWLMFACSQSLQGLLRIQLYAVCSLAVTSEMALLPYGYEMLQYWRKAIKNTTIRQSINVLAFINLRLDQSALLKCQLGFKVDYSTDNCSSYSLIIQYLQQQMDNQELSDYQLQLAIKFAEVLRTDLADATSILSSFNWNIQKAFGSIDLSQNDKPKESSKNEKNSELKEKAKQRPLINRSQIKAKSIDKKANILTQIKFPSKEKHIMEVPLDSELEANKFFLGYITQKYHPALTFSQDSLSSNLKKSYDNKKYLLVYIHIIDQSMEQIYNEQITRILKDAQVARRVQKNCILYGVIEGSQDHASIAQLLPYSEDKFVFALFYYDKIRDKPQFLAQYLVGIEPLPFIDWIPNETGVEQPKRGKASKEDKPITQHIGELRWAKQWEYFQDDKQNEQVSEMWRSWENPSYEWQPPHEEIRQQQMEEWQIEEQEQKQKGRIKQRVVDPPIVPSKRQSKVVQESEAQKSKEANLMHEQDELYKKLQKSYMRKRNQSKILREDQSKKEEELALRRKQAKVLFAKVQGEGSIEVKIRLPDGSNKVHKFSPKQPVEHMFIYVDCFCREHFEQRFSEFDLTMCYSQLVLGRVRKESIGSVVGEERVVIIVKQI